MASPNTFREGGFPKEVCFRDGQCPLPFEGLGEHGNRISAGQGVEECSAEVSFAVLHVNRQVAGFLFFYFFFCRHDLY